jgi:hypothetical protein
MKATLVPVRALFSISLMRLLRVGAATLTHAGVSGEHPVIVGRG